MLLVYHTVARFYGALSVSVISHSTIVVEKWMITDTMSEQNHEAKRSNKRPGADAGWRFPFAFVRRRPVTAHAQR